ncbi:gamma-tubulin complex component 2 homolog isoform X2 [Drosophila bipectinata]|uniref:gamma-tubulin complex component 2 homolog isoform X2 n=1 Tax=Drosophila bipectinata TaxID=42026 RepID=UPI0007E6D647|nr:gamma-tubulin complex component 2 homolog isoform X2 [Drosophila bipectinata]
MFTNDSVRQILADLIEETQTPITPDDIIREFRATYDRRLSVDKLIDVLVTISRKRPQFLEVTKEITEILRTKDPMFALLVFAERYSNDERLKAPFPPRLIGMASVSSRPRKTSLSSKSPSKKSSSSSISGSASATSIASTSTTSSSSAAGADFVRSNAEDLRSQTESARSHSESTRSQVESGRGHADSVRNHVLEPRKSQAIPTSTPVNNRKVVDGDASAGQDVFGKPQHSQPLQSQESQPKEELDRERCGLSIKERVLNAVSNTSIGSSRSLGGELLGGKSATSLRSGGAPYIAPPVGTPDEYRTHMLWDYCNVEGAKMPQPEIGALPLNGQQRVVLTELLYCLTGVRGSFISPITSDPDSDGVSRFETSFTVHAQLDRSLVELVREILPLASHFVGIQRIVTETNNQGQVINSLNEALQNLTHDFYLLLIQAEQELQMQQLTVQKLLFYLHPTKWVMEEIWTSLVDLQLTELRGAAVLSHLHARIKRLEGDRAAQQLIIGLTRKAAEPYMQMLQLWIQKGVIVDRGQEFLVEDNEVIHRNELPEHYSDDYWEKRYTVRRDRIPTFLEKYSDKILRTGKYLNVIRQCGKRVMPTQQMELEFDPSSERHVTVINDAYYFAARMLLDVLLTENDLMGHLQSVKRYLLLNQGDFTMQFMDACEDELSKNVDLVLPMTLENLLGLTLRLSSARNDPYKDDLHCELLTYDLVTQMSKIMNQKEEYWQSQDRLDLSGLECFAFTYEVKWPVSLVLNHIAISKYQMLFRQLFYCKHVERQLCKIWKENSIAKKFSPHAAELYRSAFTLRQRMMNAIQNLEYYMMIEIIEPNWHIFIEKMKKVENVDNVLRLHQDFLDSCLKNCMLTESSHLNRAIFKLCKICLKFCEFIQRSQRFFLDAELKSMVCDSSDDSTDSSESDPECSHRPQVESTLDPTDTFSERVKRFDLEFTGLLISFLKQINNMAKKNTADRFMNLVHRINFNAFYTDQMDKLCMNDALG